MVKRRLAVVSMASIVGVVLAACGGDPPSTATEQDPLSVSTCVTIERGSGTSAVADTYIKPNALRDNFGTRPSLRVSASDETLLRFDLGAIPHTATITSATMLLFANGQAGDGTIRVHRITTPWTETGVTYSSFHQGFAADLVAALRLERRTTQKSVDLTSLVASWVRGTQPNYGVELDEGPDHHPLRDRDCDDDNDPTLFVSSEGTAAHRPALQVCYSVFVDECAADPCHHGGTCTNHDSGFTCACAAGFSGPTCDTALDHCASSPCENGGGCTNTDDGYTCACPAGFSGTNCETNINDCASVPCQNGGVCTDGIASYTCACAPGYDGANCEHLIDNCASDPCHNGGACTNEPNSFACSCATGFSGVTCDTNIDDCVGNACVNGTCVDGIASYTCACAPDWGGAHCDVNLNSCAQNPCLDGGTCADGFGTYTCTCAAGYTGANCENDINDCAPNPCQNNGLCVDGVASYSCTCPSGFTGANCETAVPPPVEIRVGGVCYAICQNADPSATGWGFENDASCVMPGDPLATSSPFCSTPVPPTAYEAPNAVVTDSTTSVATIPRPAHITVDPAHDCPYNEAGLVAFDPTWIAADGSITVPANVRVLIRGNLDLPAANLISRLYVPATSEIIFADQAATFRVTDIMIDGAMRLGSATCRLESAISFVFDTDEDISNAAVRTTIYNRMGLGIMVGPTGVLEMFGHLYQPTWTRLAATANIGDTQIVLAEPVDWVPGQQIVIATSERADYPIADGNEQRTIVAVAGTLVTIDQPLAAQHYGGAEYQVEVGLLSHNLAFSTADRLVAEAPTFGGHIMVHSKNARVSGVQLYGMGQQNYLARYPFHFHLSGDVGNASYFTDSSIVHSNWRCAVIHRTDESIVSRNVAYDNFGHCFYIEDGVEMNNEVSYNLAVKTKIMGPTDAASITAMQGLGQTGFTLAQSADFAQPADRAASGFYITNGNNKIIGNASSGGFAGFSFPNLPQAIGGSTERIFPILYGASYFDGNTAHSSGYLWTGGPGACIYIGGTLTETNGQLSYTSGRSTDFTLLRQQGEVFNNTKTFLCESGITHWGSSPRLVNFEAWDDGIMATLFGAASIQSSLSVGQTGNPLQRPLNFFQRGFQFYDTGTQTILKDVVFRHYHHDTATDTWATTIKEWDSCALLSMTHSDEYTPQRMNAVEDLHFTDVDDPQRLCVSNTGTLSSRNFNLVDTDGSMSREPGDTFAAGPRLVASEYATSWLLSPACQRHDNWGAIVCPLVAPQNIASIATEPNASVGVTMYGLDNTTIGTNGYSATDYPDSQITGPSGIGWHHAFPGGVPDSFEIEAIQVPDGSFVLFSLTLPAGVSCAIHDPAWTAAPDLATLLHSTSAMYTTAQDTCFVRIPPTAVGDFEASGLSVPNRTWYGNPTPTTYFTLDTGCAGNPACQGVVSTLPTLPQ